MTTTLTSIINQKLTAELTPHYLEVVNESAQHNVPEYSETHFKVVIVSLAFQNLSLVKRHQLIYATLQTEMKKANGIHALSIHCYTPSEWETRQQQVADSPKCRGGNKQ